LAFAAIIGKCGVKIRHKGLPMPFRLVAAAALCVVAAQPVLAQSLEQMAGQMIVVGFVGDSVDDKSVAAMRAEIANGDIGGVMFLKTNVASRSAVIAMNEAFRAAAPDLKPFITLDQEGGVVERLTEAVGFTEIPSAATIAKTIPVNKVRPLFNAQARGVADWGFSVNFAPVVDLDLNPDNQVIGKFGRSFGSGANTVTVYAEQVIAAHHEAGVLTALKHYPGHGSSTADSHEGYVDITRTWSDKELEPYRQLIGSGYADFVMVGHLIDTEIDPSGVPSSLSHVWINDTLRNSLGFDGVVITDDLEMGAIRDHYGLEETVVRAVKAGVDVLLFSNTVKPRTSLGDEVRAILVNEAEADPAFRARIEESYKRIVALKTRIGS
jgi:beta-N-acetylhexosaminidase